jgi:hypothetical protein
VKGGREGGRMGDGGGEQIHMTHNFMDEDNLTGAVMKTE